MDYTEYTAVKRRFTSAPTLCELFKLLSFETWKRIEYAYLMPRVKVYETTLTQNIIFTANAYNDEHNLHIDIFEALDEETNGNDFELVIKYPAHGAEFYAPIQAKKINRQLRYASLDHGNQIESLLEYARVNCAQAMYLLYNYDEASERIDSNAGITGCTLVSAKYLFDNYYRKRLVRKRDGTREMKWRIPGFTDLNPSQAFQWHELVCPDNPSDLYIKLKAKGVVPSVPPATFSRSLVLPNSDFRTGFFPIGTHESVGSWINVKDSDFSLSKLELRRPAAFRLFTEEEAKQFGKERIFPKFSPKSRMVLTIKV